MGLWSWASPLLRFLQDSEIAETDTIIVLKIFDLGPFFKNQLWLAAFYTFEIREI